MDERHYLNGHFAHSCFSVASSFSVRSSGRNIDVGETEAKTGAQVEAFNTEGGSTESQRRPKAKKRQGVERRRTEQSESEYMRMFDKQVVFRDRS